AAAYGSPLSRGRQAPSRYLVDRWMALAFQAQALELAVERRAADFQPPRHFRHLPVMVGDGEADDLALDLLERAHVPGRVGEVQRRRGGLARLARPIGQH